MLFSINKHFLKNFKNFIISQYNFNFKNFNFNEKIYLKISFLKKNFFLATFFLYSFCIFKYNFKNTSKNSNLILSKSFFFFIFNKFYYPNLLNITKILKKSKSLFSINFILDNFFFLPISSFFYTNLRWIKKKKILINLNFFFKKIKFNFFLFFFNFFQIPIFLKNDF